MKIEFKRQQNLEWVSGDVIIVQWKRSYNESLKHLFFVAEDDCLFDPKDGLIYHIEYGDENILYWNSDTIEVLEVFKNENLVLTLG